MQQLQPGMMEYEVEAIFLNHAYRHGGCRSHTILLQLPGSVQQLHAASCIHPLHE